MELTPGHLLNQRVTAQHASRGIPNERNQKRWQKDKFVPGFAASDQTDEALPRLSDYSLAFCLTNRREELCALTQMKHFFPRCGCHVGEKNAD
jgi:hypothetical protein